MGLRRITIRIATGSSAPRGPRRAARQHDLRADLLSLFARTNKADDGTMVAPSGYLEVVITKR
jgi:hypothetical protein